MLLPEVPLQKARPGESLPIEIKLVLQEPATKPGMPPPVSLIRDIPYRRNRFKNAYYQPQYPSNVRYGQQQRPSRNRYSFMRDYGGLRQRAQDYQDPYYSPVVSSGCDGYQNQNQYPFMRDYGPVPSALQDFQVPTFRPLAGYANARRPVVPRPSNSWYLDQSQRRPSQQGYQGQFFNDYSRQGYQQYGRQFFRDGKGPAMPQQQMMQQQPQSQQQQNNQQCGCCMCQPCCNNPPPPNPPNPPNPPPLPPERPSFRKVVVNEGE